MNIGTFLQQVRQDTSYFDKQVICFQGNYHPILFISFLVSWLKRLGQTVSFIDIKEHSIEAQSQLKTSFLGNSTMYILKQVTDLSSTEYKQWMKFLDAYDGPHTVLFSCQNVPKEYKKIVVVPLPESVDAALFEHLWQLCSLDDRRKPIDATIFMRNLSLDDACMLLYYVTFAGKNSDLFVTEWLDKIFKPSSSLFTLSSSFFAWKVPTFFREWLRVKDVYPQAFWVSFWSEQLFRAAEYVQLMKEKKRAEAKRISFKLPFSFINYDWKRHSFDTLKSAHEQLYTIDYRMKNGSVMPALDLFYFTFFA